MIGRLFGRLAASFLTDVELQRHVAMLRSPPKHVSKHRNQRNLKRGRCYVADNSSVMKRMRAVDGFKEVHIKPARRREHWSAFRRAVWSSFSNLADTLERDRMRRRYMLQDMRKNAA